MIQRSLFIGFLFFLFLLEGTLLQWLVPDSWGTTWTFVPALSFVAILLVAIFFDERRGLIYAALFGLMHDLAFGLMLGAYTFSYVLITYYVSSVIKQFHQSNVFVVVTVVLGVILQVASVYGLFVLFGVTQMDWRLMLYRVLIPTAVFNLLFVLVMLQPLKVWVNKLKATVDEHFFR